MPKLHPITFSPAVAKAGGNMNSDAGKSHFSPSSDDASSHDHVNALKTALDRDTEESADVSDHNKDIVSNLANKGALEEMNLFQKSNNPTLSSMKSEFYKEVDQRMDNIAQENNPNSIMTNEYFEEIWDSCCLFKLPMTKRGLGSWEGTQTK